MTASRRARRRGATALAASLVTTAGFAATAGAASAPPPLLLAARLQGPFLLAGRVTVATGVPGEYAGQAVLRTWTFVPACAAGSCPTIGLIRERPTGTDRIVLRLAGPALYTASGSFFAPLRCGRRRYRRGAAVPFTIMVSITAAAPSGGATLATEISATYTNRARRNLTRCVAVPGHDAASYQGQLIHP